MRTLLALLATLLLVAPALGQPLSGKGLVDNYETASLPTCEAGLWGMRVYDIDVNQGKICSETAAAWVTMACGQVLWGVVDPTEAQVTPDFIDLRDNAGSTTESNEQNFSMPSSTMLISNLACTVNVAPGAGDQWTIDVRAGTAGSLADTALDCEIADTDTTCTNNTDVVAVTAAQVMTIGIESDDGATAPTAAATMDCRFCLGQ